MRDQSRKENKRNVNAFMFRTCWNSGTLFYDVVNEKRKKKEMKRINTSEE
jgi:hypothetical protein